MAPLPMIPIHATNSPLSKQTRDSTSTQKNRLPLAVRDTVERRPSKEREKVRSKKTLFEGQAERKLSGLGITNLQESISHVSTDITEIPVFVPSSSSSTSSAAALTPKSDSNSNSNSAKVPQISARRAARAALSGSSGLTEKETRERETNEKERGRRDRMRGIDRSTETKEQIPVSPSALPLSPSAQAAAEYAYTGTSLRFPTPPSQVTVKLRHAERTITNLEFELERSVVPVSEAAQKLIDFCTATRDPLVPSVWGETRHPHLADTSKRSRGCCVVM